MYLSLIYINYLVIGKNNLKQQYIWPDILYSGFRLDGNPCRHTGKKYFYVNFVLFQIINSLKCDQCGSSPPWLESSLWRRLLLLLLFRPLKSPEDLSGLSASTSTRSSPAEVSRYHLHTVSHLMSLGEILKVLKLQDQLFRPLIPAHKTQLQSCASGEYVFQSAFGIFFLRKATHFLDFRKILRIKQ